MRDDCCEAVGCVLCFNKETGLKLQEAHLISTSFVIRMEKDVTGWPYLAIEDYK